MQIKKDTREIVIRAGISAAGSLLGDEISNSISSRIHVGKHERVSLIKKIAIGFISESQNSLVEVAKEIVPSGFLNMLISLD